MEQNSFGKFWLKLTVFALSIVLLVVGYYAIFSRDYGLIAQHEHNIKIEAQLKEVNLQIINLQDKYKICNYQIDSISRKQSQMESNLNNFTRTNDFKLSDLDTLLGIANQSLVLYNDVEYAFRLLTVANNLALSESGPEFESLQISIKQDIDQLQQTQVTASTMLITQNISKLMVLQTKLIKKDKSATADTNNKNGFWSGLKRSLSSLIQIRKISNESQSHSSVSSGENLEPSFSSLTIALNSHNQQAWVAQLQMLELNINNNYQQNLYSKEALDIIKFLESIDLNKLKSNNINQTMIIMNQILKNNKK